MNSKNQSHNKCLFCGDRIQGRSDKKYCDDGCRNAANNNAKMETHKAIRDIDLILKKNRKILKELLGDKEYKILSKEKLEKKGYNQQHYTHHKTARTTGNVFTFCYDYGFRIRDDGSYNIVRAFDKVVSTD
ncbi:MAG: hypothetical protein JWN76_1279 [Chitinophagaceae bacterium]|nr:hypothetical protein [Chitinophagaceae bacterium]